VTATAKKPPWKHFDVVVGVGVGVGGGGGGSGSGDGGEGANTSFACILNICKV
jgi:hypothetical protein